MLSLRKGNAAPSALMCETPRATVNSAPRQVVDRDRLRHHDFPNVAQPALQASVHSGERPTPPASSECARALLEIPVVVFVGPTEYTPDCHRVRLRNHDELSGHHGC